MLRSFHSRRAVFLTLLFAATGCGKSGLVPVKGVVKLNGQLLADASVMFIAQDEGGKDATGYTDGNGVFHLSTYKPGDGAMRGKYKVVVQTAARSEGPPAGSQEDAQKRTADPNKSPPPLIAARFSQPDLTILTQQVPANGDVVLDVKSE
jgi:hypothetical protein